MKPPLPAAGASARRLPLLLLLLALLVSGARADMAGILVPQEATPILPVSQVRIGMKGYGLSVFHGTAIESFPIEVISVQSDFAPRHSVIWVRCTDARMQKSGAVEGMSGSPMFLWGPDEPQVPGKGGKLIGAFAFGYSSSLDCYVGVQPIEYMRQVGTRIDQDTNTTAAAAGADGSGGPVVALSGLRALLGSPLAARMGPARTWRARAIQKLLASPADALTAAPHDAALDVPAPAGLAGRPLRLLLPMAVGSADMQAALAPLLEPLGIMPMQGAVGITGTSPPPGIVPHDIRIQPGAVLSIPLAWGDMDLNAAGTVTDVLPNGHVLAFGHAMFGQGPLAVPMATGYVHLVMPSRDISFKLANSAEIRGSIVRDEQSGIAGDGDVKYTSSPADFVINIPGHDRIEYHFQVVHLKALTPTLAAIVGMECLTAQQNMPIENTARVHGDLVFAGNRDLHLDITVPDLSAGTLVMELLPPLSAMIQNPLESMMLQSMDITVDVQPALRMATLSSARLERDQVAPGDDALIIARMKPYARPAFDQRVRLHVPVDLAEGDYDVLVCDAQTYLANLYNTRPYMMNIDNANELFAMVQQVMGLPSDSLYVVLQGRPDGVAIGRQPLPNLPSSRRAILAAQSNSVATPFADSVESIVPVGMVVSGNAGFTLTVKKKPAQD